MSICSSCGGWFEPLGLANHRASCWERKRRGGKSPKEFVLSKYPEAVSWSWADCVEIYSKRHNEGAGNKTLGRGVNAQQAWDNAARNLK